MNFSKLFHEINLFFLFIRSNNFDCFYKYLVFDTAINFLRYYYINIFAFPSPSSAQIIWVSLHLDRSF